MITIFNRQALVESVSQMQALALAANLKEAGIRSSISYQPKVSPLSIALRSASRPNLFDQSHRERTPTVTYTVYVHQQDAELANKIRQNTWRTGGW